MDNKWYTTTELYDNYERRFAVARLEKTLTCPWEKADREQILAGVKKMLGWQDALVPQIGQMEAVSTQQYDGYQSIQYRYRTWEHFYGASTLYMPDTEEKVPLVFVCCGHGDDGRLTGSYMAMGHRLASLGIAALVMDNIGQGDRPKNTAEFKTPDHWYSIAPFYCGLTLQGMIVMETVALIRHMAKDSRFDPDKLGACGNSGGGTLTMFLAAMAPELKVLSSSGYPSELRYLLTKERRHCACNLLLGAAYGPEMWEIYSLFAPKPLLLEGGKHDNLIPLDLAHRNARKVKNTYVQLGSDAFRFQLTDTRHSWVLEDINLISAFLAEQLLGVTPAPAEDLYQPEDITPFRVQMPADMLTTDDLAQAITGITMPQGTKLWDIFPPPADMPTLAEDAGRGETSRVFAQMECALYKE